MEGCLNFVSRKSHRRIWTQRVCLNCNNPESLRFRNPPTKVAIFDSSNIPRWGRMEPHHQTCFAWFCLTNVSNTKICFSSVGPLAEGFRNYLNTIRKVGYVQTEVEQCFYRKYFKPCPICRLVEVRKLCRISFRMFNDWPLNGVVRGYSKNTAFKGPPPDDYKLTNGFRRRSVFDFRESLPIGGGEVGRYRHFGGLLNRKLRDVEARKEGNFGAA